MFASATSAAIFLFVNGLLLFAFERLRRRAPGTEETDPDEDRTDRASRHLAPGDERRRSAGAGADSRASRAPGITMGGGLLVGLNNRDAARFGFLLATPIIFAAAALKLPDLLGKDGQRRARPRARRGALRGAHGLPLGAIPDALLRDQPAHPVRDLLLRRGRGLDDRLCRYLTGGFAR